MVASIEEREPNEAWSIIITPSYHHHLRAVCCQVVPSRERDSELDHEPVLQQLVITLASPNHVLAPFQTTTIVVGCRCDTTECGECRQRRCACGGAAAGRSAWRGENFTACSFGEGHVFLDRARTVRPSTHAQHNANLFI